MLILLQQNNSCIQLSISTACTVLLTSKLWMRTLLSGRTLLCPFSNKSLEEKVLMGWQAYALLMSLVDNESVILVFADFCHLTNTE